MISRATILRQPESSPTNGYSLVELMVTVSLVAIVAGIALPRWDPKRVQLSAAQRSVIANLRLARTSAISKSVHYQVSFPTVTQIRVSRMQENPVGSGTWQVDTSNVQTIKLPSVTQVKSSVVGNSVEFNSRGIALNLTALWQIDLQDTYGNTKSLQVWPSGQVNEV